MLGMTTLEIDVNKSRIKELKNRRKEAIRNVERFEKLATKKSAFVREHFLKVAQQWRDEEWACKVALGRHL